MSSCFLKLQLYWGITDNLWLANLKCKIQHFKGIFSYASIILITLEHFLLSPKGNPVTPRFLWSPGSYLSAFSLYWFVCSRYYFNCCLLCVTFLTHCGVFEVHHVVACISALSFLQWLSGPLCYIHTTILFTCSSAHGHVCAFILRLLWIILPWTCFWNLCMNT